MMKKVILFSAVLLVGFLCSCDLCAQSCQPSPACKAVCSAGKAKTSATTQISPISAESNLTASAKPVNLVSTSAKAPVKAANCNPANCNPANCDPKNCDPAQCDPAKCDPAQCLPANCKPEKTGSIRI